MSRAGPRPVWTQLDAGEAQTLCSFRMAWPGQAAEQKGASFSVVSSVRTMENTLEFSKDGLQLSSNQS